VAKVPCVHGAFGLGQAPKKNLQAYITTEGFAYPGRGSIYRHTFVQGLAQH